MAYYCVGNMLSVYMFDSNISYSCLIHCAVFFFLNLQGEKDWQKYETARRLKKCVDRIRAQYREDWKSKEMRIRQRAVALYFIDKVRCMMSIDSHIPAGA